MKSSYIEKIIEIMPSLPRVMRFNLERDVVKPPLQSFHQGLAPHHMAIMKFVQLERRPHIGEICEFSRISKAQMTNSIDKLISLGMVAREPDPDDRRKITITLTDKGQNAVAKLDAVINERMREKLSQLSDNELKKVAEALKYLVTTLEKLK
jgi:DNA-binding MarR family transcriptional regulator